MIIPSVNINWFSCSQNSFGTEGAEALKVFVRSHFHLTELRYGNSKAHHHKFSSYLQSQMESDEERDYPEEHATIPEPLRQEITRLLEGNRKIVSVCLTRETISRTCWFIHRFYFFN